MPSIKSLAKDTAVYGLSSIVGRFLNWCLVPLYVYIFPSQQYGIVSYLYSFTAVMLVILNYGMETGFFRFANAPGQKSPQDVYKTSLVSVGCTSLAFVILLSLAIGPVSRAILMGSHPWYVWILGVTVAVDAFTNIPFAWLRFRNKAWRFAAIKIVNVAANIALNLFFLLACPWIDTRWPGVVGWFYRPLGGEAFGVGWIFLANILSTAIVLAALVPDILSAVPGRFRSALWKRMVSYSWPLLILGVAGILSQNMGQILIPYIFDGHEAEARSMVGIYGANIKIAIVMVMFTQAFRYAYEPFIFAQARQEGADKKGAYASAMRYFVLFGLVIFVGVMYFLPVLKHFISPGYWSGLRVVPVMMAAELCFGVYFNLSMWYKLTDRTHWGMVLSLLCFAIMLGLNLWLVPAIGIPDGYMGSAWAALGAYFSVMAVSWWLGRKYYPIDYHLGAMGLYALGAMLFWGMGELAYWPDAMWATYTVRFFLLAVFICGMVAADPGLRRMAGRHHK